MNRSLLARMVGRILLIGAACMTPSLLLALMDHTPDTRAFAITIGIMLALGGASYLLKTSSDTWRPRDALGAVTISWLAISAFGALPFTLSGFIPSYVDAFFESVSGFTTTGSTILLDIESLPRSLLFWRSFTHWIGGMGVLVLSLAVLPRMGGRSLFLLRAESAGPDPGKMVPRIGVSVRLSYSIYIILSVILTVILLFCGMDLYDALIHTFGTAGTGGFSNYAASVGHFHSASVDVVISIFMLLFGVNFTMYFCAVTRNFKAIWRSTELRLYVVAVVVSVLAIAVSILPRYADFGTAVRYSLFQVSSIITTTGYATDDFNLWPTFARCVLVLFMFTGCCAGSTGGGMKLIRVSILLKNLYREIRKTVRPREVNIVRIDGRAASEEIVSSVHVFFFAYIFVIITAVLFCSFDGLDFESTSTAVIACIGNIGPGLGQVGPVGNFAMFSPISKIVLSLCMLIGRLDIFPILMIFTRKAWSRP